MPIIMTENLPSFSIITVSLNSVATIKDAIQSIANQDYQDIEHIIVDGGSVDGTLDVISSSPTVKRYVSEPDQGIYDAMNKGIAMASGDIVGILNADDFYAKRNAISLVASAFQDPEIDVCYGDLVYVKKEDSSKIVRYWKSRPYKPGLFLRGWMPAHPTFFVRRKYFDELGDYDINYHFQSDFELTMRFLEIYRLKSHYIPEILIKMRMGGVTNRSLKNILLGNIEAVQACRKNNLQISPLFSFYKIISRLPQFFYRPG